MKINFHVYGDRRNRWLLVVCTLLVAGLWAMTTALVGRHAALAPLHYTIYFGVDLTGPAHRLWWLPAAGTVSLMSHVWIGRLPFEPVWSRSWLIMNVLIELLLMAVAVTLWFVARPTLS